MNCWRKGVIMSSGFYPAGPGLISYIFGSAHSAFGANRWSDIQDAAAYAQVMQDFFPAADCHVINEFFPEAPDYQWRVICEGKSK